MAKHENSVDWKDEEKRAKLKRLIEQGMGPTDIGKQFGVTKNSIIGIVLRIRKRDPTFPHWEHTHAKAGRKGGKRTSRIEAAGQSHAVPRFHGHRPRSKDVSQPRTTIARGIDNQPAVVSFYVWKKPEKLDVFDKAMQAKATPLMKLRHKQCRWVVTDDNQPFLFCTHEQLNASSYCSFHHHWSTSRFLVPTRSANTKTWSYPR